jgi:hypothetical protein
MRNWVGNNDKFENVKKAKEKIGGNVKALLTEKAKSIYSPKFEKTMIINNKTILLGRLTLVLEK